MTELFVVLPTVDILSRLIKGSLKQNLAKAMRLWIILDSLYSDRGFLLETEFSLYQWQEKFFSGFEDVHKLDDVKKIKSHHPECPCQRSLKDWLLLHLSEEELVFWKQTFLQRYSPISNQELDILLKQEQLFAVSRRTLQYDFDRLVEMNFLNSHPAYDNLKDKVKYQKIFPLPTWLNQLQLSDSTIVNTSNLINNDLADFFQDFGQEINGQQRFFLDLEYIIHRKFSLHIEQLRQSLKQIWSQDIISPIHLKYFSARQFQDQNNAETYLTFPVCLYYSQRVPYLFAFGQTPQGDHINWYDFRLDRIQSLTALTWEISEIEKWLGNFQPQHQTLNAFENRLIHVQSATERASIYQHYCCQELTPQYIHDLKAEAWGFDFFRPKQTMILRFDQYFHARYIQGTERDEWFQQLSLEEVKRSLQLANLSYDTHQTLLKKIQTKKKDIYCRVNYREDDFNIIMRLRAWGPNVEVFTPINLRETMKKDAQQIAASYS